MEHHKVDYPQVEKMEHHLDIAKNRTYLQNKKK